MRTNGYVFAFIFAFATILDVVYWYLSKDPTGTTCIALTAGLGFLISFYLLFTARRMEGRPEDRADADVSEGAGEIGHFSPGSWWPLLITMSIVPLLLGIVFGLWLTAIGVIFLFMATSGLLLEHYTGAQARDW